jgi:excisionase family DNA binding protein
MTSSPCLDRLLTAREVADLIGVSVRHVEDLTRQGAIPFVPIGRFRRYRRDSIEQWIAEQERGGQ